MFAKTYPVRVLLLHAADGGQPSLWTWDPMTPGTWSPSDRSSSGCCAAWRGWPTPSALEIKKKRRADALNSNRAFKRLKTKTSAEKEQGDRLPCAIHHHAVLCPFQTSLPSKEGQKTSRQYLVGLCSCTSANYVARLLLS